PASLLFLHATATAEIHTLSLHDALPISAVRAEPGPAPLVHREPGPGAPPEQSPGQFPHLHRPLELGDALQLLGHHEGLQLPLGLDRKSTRLNSSHVKISYAVFCLKKKKK